MVGDFAHGVNRYLGENTHFPTIGSGWHASVVDDEEIPSAKTTLAKNLKALMERSQAQKEMGTKPMGPASIKALSEASKVSRRAIKAILVEAQAAGIDTLQAIATAYGQTAWALLVPGFEPAYPPMLREASQAEKDFLRSLAETQDRLRVLDQTNARKQANAGAVDGSRDRPRTEGGKKVDAGIERED